MSTKPKAVWMIIAKGRVSFWDGFLQRDQEFWDGQTLTLTDFEGNVKRRIISGSFDVLAPLMLHKNIFRPYPMIRLGGQN